jgi:hypothetical protein
MNLTCPQLRWLQAGYLYRQQGGVIMKRNFICAYHVVDFCNLTEEQRKDLESWSFDCLTTVAALGFGDIPAKAFIEAFNILQKVCEGQGIDAAGLRSGLKKRVMASSAAAEFK